ncbi:unnamed protein product [Pleuronectes platessa]|uniref:Uncharacterized protein n=1 Tax=Pleuronectes platessa TaxID=8262 RepID=A0A9N7YY19_PLEPL|nr:unnamed protein product [Pleuronectes platessa]
MIRQLRIHTLRHHQPAPTRNLTRTNNTLILAPLYRHSRILTGVLMPDPLQLPHPHARATIQRLDIMSHPSSHLLHLQKQRTPPHPRVYPVVAPLVHPTL